MVNTFLSKDHQQLALWAADCAERVLMVFENASDDPRPRQAIDAARKWANGEISVSEARKAAFGAHAAAREVTDSFAKAAARSAGHAAATAHVITHSKYAETYALKAKK